MDKLKLEAKSEHSHWSSKRLVFQRFISYTFDKEKNYSYSCLFYNFTGIAHLHEGINPSIIHRDIKPSNILIGDGFEAKVSDFGLVKSGPIGDNSHVSSQIKGTPGYLDPAYCASFHLSQFSDVYSFGVILLQLVSSRPAVDMTGNRPNHHIIDWVNNLHYLTCCPNFVNQIM